MADIYPVTVPKWGIEMQEGAVVRWRFAAGDVVKKGDELVDIETDKIVNTMEAPSGGVLRRCLAAEGETLSVGALLGVIASAETNEAGIDTFIADFKPADAAFALDDGDNETGVEPAAATATGAAANIETAIEKPRVSPAAARLAKNLGVDLARVTGTGRDGRVSTEDIKAYAAQNIGDNKAADGAEYEVIAMSARRKTIARKLVAAKQQIPHFYLTVDIEMEAALAHRQAINSKSGNEISVNDVVTRACVLALQSVPEVNIQVRGEEIHRFKHINIAVAVSTDEGLFTPVVRQAETLDLPALAEKIKSLRARARDNTLQPDETRHGSFTVSNLGMHGIKTFQGVINPPQGALLAVSSVARQLVPDGDGVRGADIMNVSLSCDHRAIDGVLGAKFLRQLKALLETPERL